MQNAYHLLTSLASERGIRRFEVRFLMGTQNFLFPTLMKRGKNIFLYFFTELKTYHLFYYSTNKIFELLKIYIQDMKPCIFFHGLVSVNHCFFFLFLNTVGLL